MKQIEEYVVNEDKTLTVKYTDGDEVVFDGENESIIKSNLAEQRKAKERKEVGACANIPEKEKEERKKETQKKLKKVVKLITLTHSQGLHIQIKPWLFCM